MVLVEYEVVHKICFHCGEFGHTEASCHYKHPGKPVSMGNPNAQAMIDLTQALKPNTAENNMVFGPWMVQQRKPRRRNPAGHNQIPTGNKSHPQSTNDSDSSQSKSGILAKSKVLDKGKGAKSSQQNRFAAIEDLMDREIELIGAIKGKEVVEAGNSSTSNKDLAAMDITPLPALEAQMQGPIHQATVSTSALPSIPPPVPDNSFAKPKSRSSKKKTKTLGPVLKEARTSVQKPYDPPLVSKKNLDSSLVPPSTLSSGSSSPKVLIEQAAPSSSLLAQQVALRLPSIQISPTSLPAVSNAPDKFHAENPPPASTSDHNVGVNPLTQLIGQVPPLVATQDPVALHNAPSK
ncbi:hypothetical protein SLE2022_396710 [Rubroshorea leprosula]